MQKNDIISAYLDNEKYRMQFNDLANHTFGINFEDWYQKGYLKNNYIPYGILKEDKIVANVSVNKFHLVIDNEVRKAVQIGTVMVDESCRNEGLARRLMAYVLGLYNEEEYLVYLFANDTVLDFYPKMGFERVWEKSYEMDTRSIVKRKVTKRVLDFANEQDYRQVRYFAENRKPVSKKLGIIKDQWPLLVYCNDTDTGALYYLEEDNRIVKAARIDKTLHIYDILSVEDFEMDDVLEKMVEEDDEKVVLHFVPDESRYKIFSQTVPKDDDALFIRQGQVFSEAILFPLTSHT